MNMCMNMGMKHQFKDEKYLTAKEKERVLKAWIRFINNGLKYKHFTKALYEHLHLHCSFIAHYDRAGFYATYFGDPEDTFNFLQQFDKDKGYRSYEYGGMTYWIRGDYGDINTAMCEEFEKVKDKIYASLKGATRTKLLLEISTLEGKLGSLQVNEEKSK